VHGFAGFGKINNFLREINLFASKKYQKEWKNIKKILFYQSIANQFLKKSTPEKLNS